jgi:predicted NBD/HSP70 family sugar kinase
MGPGDMKVGPSLEDIRRRNLGTLLRHVHLGGPLSRATLADRMGLNRSTIMALTADLTSAGLVREELPKDTGLRGRPSLLVRPESNRVYVLAFDVRSDRLVAARVGLGGSILDRREAIQPRNGNDLDNVVRTLAEIARQLERDTRSDAICVGVGAAYCGMVRPIDGMVRFGPNAGWVDQALGTELGLRLGYGMPVLVGNDANLGALAEYERGAGIGCQNLIYMHGDVGVGGGIIVGGKLLYGDGGYGGEIGHTVVNPRDGRPCRCGSRGCLEAEVGGRALIAAANLSTKLVARDAIRALVDASDRGDLTARDSLHQVGDWLGIGIANLVNVFNPGMVIFGGTLGKLYLGAGEQVRRRLMTNALTVSREGLRLHTPALGDDAILVGAAELAFSQVLASPLEVLTHRTS